MTTSFYIDELARNKRVFHELLSEIPKEQYIWKSEVKQWNLLEIVCHLYDEECEDFKVRIRSILHNPKDSLPPINPAAWVQERKYLSKNYQEVLSNFLKEREQSILWLQLLDKPKWENTHLHPKLGPMSAALLLANWVAHDYLHLRQITQRKFQYLKLQSDESLDYAGSW